MSGGYEVVIGLEIHVQLATRTKLFCGDAAAFGGAPNTRVCPVCLGLPGALPVLNGAAVELAVRAAVGLDCVVHHSSTFARKNYFYPDLPKGYQITQFDRPLATGGHITAEDGQGGDEGRVRIRRLQLEEDAGRSLHDRVAGRTAVDLNRAGVPLMEIVTAPDLRSPAQARAFLGRLKQRLEYLEVSDCDMEKGSLRVDANLSLRPAGAEALGTKTELKNMNSFAQLERALEFEADRQARLLTAGRRVLQETLLWDPVAGTARPVRSKEESEDYRYFPEPDLPPLVVSPGEVEAARGALPELPEPRRRRFREDYGLPDYDAGVLTATRPLADYFEAVAAALGDGKLASNWVMGDVLAWLNARGADIASFPVPGGRLAELIGLVRDGVISAASGRDVLGEMAGTGRAAAEIVEERGLAQVRDRGRIAAWVDAALAEHAAEAERLRAGEAKLMGFFMGRVMERSGGRADPRLAAALLRERAGTEEG